MLTVNLHNAGTIKAVTVPEDWNELSGLQLQALSKILFSARSALEARTKIVCTLLGLSPGMLRRVAPEVMHETLLALSDPFLKNSSLTCQLLPGFRLGIFRTKFCGPTAELNNLRFCEYDAAERALFRLRKDPADINLYRLVAVLYRKRAGKATAEDDLREPFTHVGIEQRALYFAKHLSLEKARSVLLWYQGCRALVHSLYPSIFRATRDGSDESEQESEPHYFPIMRLIADRGIYGDLDKVEQLYLFTVMEELVASGEEKKAMDEEIKKRQNKK